MIYYLKELSLETYLRIHLFNSFYKEFSYIISINKIFSSIYLSKSFKTSLKTTSRFLAKKLNIVYESIYEQMRFIYEKNKILLRYKH